MEDKLKSKLLEGETLLWSGRPETFETLDLTHKQYFIKKTIIAALIAAVLAAAYVLLAVRLGANISWVVIVLIIACAAASPIGFFSSASKLRKEVLYAVTNKRLLIVCGEIRSIPHENVKTALFKTDADGHTSFIFGSKAEKSKPYSWRNAALFGLFYEDCGEEECDLMAFYAVSDAEALKKIVAPYISL